MPKQAIDYSKTIIYKIEHSIDKSLLYVGHTTDFITRKHSHKISCNCKGVSDHHTKKYQMIRDNGGWDMFQMLEIKKFPCQDSNEARAEEERVRIELNASLNSVRAFGIPKPEQDREYREANQEKIKASKKQYRIDNRERLNAKSQAYLEEHRDEINEQKRNHYQEIKDKRHEKNKIQVTCECGMTYTQCNKARHLKTQFHLDNI